MSSVPPQVSPAFPGNARNEQDGFCLYGHPVKLLALGKGLFFARKFVALFKLFVVHENRRKVHASRLQPNHIASFILLKNGLFHLTLMRAQMKLLQRNIT